MAHQLDLARFGRMAHGQVDAADRGQDVGQDAVTLRIARDVVEQHHRVADLALIDVDDAADLALALGAARCASPRRPPPSARARRASPASARWISRKRRADRRWCSWQAPALRELSITVPWRGRVGERRSREPGWGDHYHEPVTPPRPSSLRSDRANLPRPPSRRSKRGTGAATSYKCGSRWPLGFGSPARNGRVKRASLTAEITACRR